MPKGDDLHLIYFTINMQKLKNITGWNIAPELEKSEFLKLSSEPMTTLVFFELQKVFTAFTIKIK